jgi:hypothetical protein
MTTDSQHIKPTRRSARTPTWADVWHPWHVVIPRRSIAGRLVRGKVWRRRDGRHWIYKEFIDHADERAD